MLVLFPGRVPFHQNSLVGQRSRAIRELGCLGYGGLCGGGIFDAAKHRFEFVGSVDEIVGNLLLGANRGRLGPRLDRRRPIGGAPGQAEQKDGET